MSRELDAEVAQKVMGWVWWVHAGERSMHPGQRFLALDDGSGWVTSTISRPAKGDEPIHGNDSVPHYSTDISAAWEVVEHLRKDGWIVHIIASECVSECMLECGPGVRGRFSSVDKSIPESICRASLKACT